MEINSIRLVNFKGIEDRELFFNDKVTVLIGDNGTGKSSFLDAISICLGTILSKTGSQFGINGRKSRPLLKNEIRKVMISPDNIEYTDVLLEGSIILNGHTIDWKREQKKTSKSLNYINAKGLSNIGKDIVNNLDKEVNLPVIVYHSTARLSYELYGKKNPYEKIGSRLDGYYACLDPRIIKQKFISWFKTFEDSALKFNKDKTLYFAFTDAITSMVPEYKDIKFHWGLDDLVGQNEDGSWLPLSNLSDGYRSIVRLTADIAYRAIKLNPHLGSDVLKETEGIVLIDEIDMHLHPKWQRGIVDNLKATFPKIQFIATTHSPFIVQSLKADEVLNLDGNQIDEHPHSMSLEKNALFMGVESVESKDFDKKERLASEYLKEISSDETDEGKIEDLKQLIENTDDPVFKARLELERLTKLHDE